jgi:flagellar biosynthesis protein FlhA
MLRPILKSKSRLAVISVVLAQGSPPTLPSAPHDGGARAASSVEMSATAIPSAHVSRGGKDIGFAVGIVLILCLFFLPVPATMIDFGLALSIALSVLILMVGLWIQKPLEFSAFPTVLLVATILRLALNISTTRLILAHGAEGPTSAGYIIGGFARLVMGGDFVIGIIVFLILVTINFLVITKGATRIAEVGARFTLDAIPGKQMAIDADLSAGLIDEKVAQARRRELEEESAFFGSMDGASKFVRGDAIAGIIILAVNIFGGIVIGVTRHNLTLSSAADIFTKLSVGDGLVTQIPALIISLAAGLLVAKGGTRGSADKAVIDQLSGYPNALFLAALLMAVLGVVPGLPFLPFAMLGGLMALVGVAHSAPPRAGKRRRGGAPGDEGGAGEGGAARLDQGAAQVLRNRAGPVEGAERGARAVAR